MSKGLEALCYLGDIAHGRKMNLDPHELKLIIENETNKKALEIIKEKEVNVFIFLHSGDLETYNDMVEDNRKLTQEEYDFLKEVLL